MLLKRIYAEAEDGKPPRLDHVALVHTGTAADQKFTPRFMLRAGTEGWARIEGDILTLNVSPEPLAYTIRREPGCYCLHCGTRLEAGDAVAREHVAAAHPGVRSPDPGNPAGYEITHAYECVLNAAQHEKFHAKPGAVHRPHLKTAEG